jgi:hypothetical protein
VSSTLLEGTRRAAGRNSGQHPLFDDLRRAEPGPEPGRSAEPAAPVPVRERGERGPRSGGDRLTLEDHLERIWEGLLAAGAAECPVCEGRLGLFGGRGVCGSCGAALA